MNTFVGDAERRLIAAAVAGAPPLDDDTIRTLRRLLRPAEMLRPLPAVTAIPAPAPVRRLAA